MTVTEKNSFEKPRYPIFNIISIVLVVFLIIRFAFTTDSPVNVILLALITFLVIMFISLIFKRHRFIELIQVFYILALAIVIKYYSIYVPNGNDVFWGGQESVKNLLNGTNIYTATYYVYNNPFWAGVPFKVFPYLPGTTIFETPFYLIFADIRYAIMFADVGIAILLYLIIRKKNEDYGRAAMSFYLLSMAITFNATSKFYDIRISDGFTDPIWCFFVLASIYLSMKNQKLASAIFVGYALATKQFAFLFFIPIVILWLKKDANFKRDYRSILISVGVVTAIILPFYLWSPSDFIHSTITSLGSQDIAMSLGQPQWNMSIPAQMTFFGINIGVKITHIIQIAVIGGLLVALRNKITNIFSATLVFLVIYTIFLAFNNFTQYFYWLTIIPYVLIMFSHSFTDYVKNNSSSSAK